MTELNKHDLNLIIDSIANTINSMQMYLNGNSENIPMAELHEEYHKVHQKLQYIYHQKKEQ